MFVFLTTVLLLAAFLLTHLLVWKIRVPNRQLRALLIIFGAVLGAWLIYAMVVSVAFMDILYVAVFCVPVGLCYVITYSGIEADSPTLSLMHFIAQQGPAGCREEEVKEFLAGRPFIKRRLTALLQSGLIREQGGKYVVAGKGSAAFRFILGYRRLYGPISRGG